MTDLSDNLLAEKLIKEFGIASIPMSAFSHGQKSENILRFCFAKSDETLELAAEKLDDFYKSVK
jgi:methionine aminotransferase